MAFGNQITVGGFRNNGGVISGWISTMQLNVPYVELKPVERRSERSPSFEVWGRGKEGNRFHMGTLWPRRTNRNGTPFHGGFITDRGPQGSMDVAVFGDFATGADMVSKTDDDDYVPNRSQSAGGEQRPDNGGFSGGSTAGPAGEYVGPGGGEANGFGGTTTGSNPGGFAGDLDDDVPF